MMGLTFAGADAITFNSGWEILMGQTEIVNYMRSTESKVSTMRYAGEWKFAGGNVDANETVAECAKRELEEEFLRPVGLALPADAIVRPFTVKQTRAIKGRSNLMNNYVAISEENPWLASLDVAEVNRVLAGRRAQFQETLHSGAFWGMSKADKEAISPEVHQLQWFSLRDAMRVLLGSMSGMLGGAPTFVNDFQQRGFEQHGIKARDPMFITAAALMELESFPSQPSLVEWCSTQDLALLKAQEQWLFAGMSQAEVDKAFKARMASNGGLNPSMKTGPAIERLRDERRRGGAKL
jgi:8-oxo-dGTP pyrophosphatase MutT (NUDIX family)